MLRQKIVGLGVLAMLLLLAVQVSASSLSDERRARKKIEMQKVPYQAEEAVQQKDYDRAIELFSKAIDSNAFTDEPHTLGRLYFGRGGAYHAKGDCPNAVPDYTKAAELTPKGDIYYSLASCHVALQQDDAALVDLTKAIEVDPDAALYRSARCKLLFNKSDYAGAIPDCQTAMAAMPKDKDLLIATGQSAEQTGNKALAAAAYRNLLAVDPGNQIATEGLQRLGER